MDDKITIIEGPPPTFEDVNDGWALSLNESRNLGGIAVTRLRTFNGPALVERCHSTWRHQHPMFLEYRSTDGLPQTAPIVAARTLEIDEGQMLILWVVLQNDEVELELGYSDDDDVDPDDDDSGQDDNQDLLP